MSAGKSTGLAIKDTAKWTEFERWEYDLKKMTPHDVVVAVEWCGVCGSDVHTISGGWGALQVCPIVVGHEVVGKVTKVGDKVTEFKVGQRVGVGAQKSSCMSCACCSSDNEQYCPEQVDGYNSRFFDGTGDAQGGYATHTVAHEQFIFPIPDGVKSEHAAPMFCAGLTVFSPLHRNGAGPGKRVGVVGIGGLGHFAVLLGGKKGMGAEVVAISHSAGKRKDALEMGASEFVSTKDDPEWFDKNAMSLDFIVCTASSNQVPMDKMLKTLKVHGHLVFVGMPEDKFEALSAGDFAGNGCYLGSSHIGSKKEVAAMLKLVDEKKIEPFVEILPMSKAAEAVTRVKSGDVRYRFVLKQDIA